MEDTCGKHDACMTDIRETAHKSEKTISKLEGAITSYIKTTQSYIDASRKDMYSRDGLMDRVGNHANQLVIQWGVFGVLFLGMLYIALK